MTNQLATIQSEYLSVPPEEFDRRLDSAKAKAQSLARIVEAQKLYTDIQGRKHLHVEAWVTIAEGYGYNIDIEWTHPLEGGGFEARAVIKDQLGQTIGHADAECGSSGDGQWVERPHFQQRSMAQTRAISKAARNRLAWVVVLAGYSPTPSEEMTGESADKTQHWCDPHQTNWFKRGKMRNFAHPIEGSKEWCNEPSTHPNGGSASQTQTQESAPLPAATVLDQLQQDVYAWGMPWDHFEIQVLGKSWTEFSKVKGATPAVALARWEAWKKAHPKQEATA